MKKSDQRRLNTIIAFIVSSPLLLLLSACTGFQLLPMDGSLSQNDNAFIQQRVRNGYQMLFLESSFRVNIDRSPALELSFIDEDLMNPYAVEFFELDPESGHFALRLIAADWEYIQVRQSYGGIDQAWVKRENSWVESDAETKIRIPFLAFVLISGPESHYLEPPLGFISSTRMLGFVFAEEGLAEVYEIAFRALDDNGESQLIETYEVWIDNMSGLPLLSRTQSTTLAYEINEFIIIEPYEKR